MNEERFRSEVINKNGIYLVKFFSHGCGHCVRFAPEYDKAAKALNKIMPVIATDDKSLMGEFGIKGFPTVKILYGNSGSKPKTFDFSGNRDAKSIIEFAITHIGKFIRGNLSGDYSKGERKNSSTSSVIILTDDNFDQKVINDSKKVWIVEFYAPWCGHCKTLEPEWEAAAQALDGKIMVGKVDATQNRFIAQRYQVDGYPSIKLFPIDGKDKISLIQTYQGPRSSKQITEYALSFYKKPSKLEQLTCQKDFLNVCHHQDDESDATICVLAFLPHILDTSASDRTKQIELLKTVAKAQSTAPVSFAWVQGGDFYLQLEDPLNLAFGYPAIIAYSNSKKMYAIHRGNFTVDSLSGFIHSLMTGKAALMPVPSSMKELVTVAAWDGKDAAKDEL